MEAFSPTPIPVDELDEEDLSCAKCHVSLTEEAYPDFVDAYFCEACMTRIVEETSREAERQAMDVCQITGPLPKYDPQYEHRPTPEEYQMGQREAYTSNAYRAHCRHNCTNYDDLIRPLNRDSVYDQIYYLAVSERIEELLEDAIDELQFEADDDDFEGDDDDFEGDDDPEDA